ncbi:hypothetical protein DRJ16_04075 [Candidatus Woesearchaeota archaeon]|nr:MAG: hypothetical protein DRJ16_04075 [Candidatus Woesearchaeota archaeon]
MVLKGNLLYNGDFEAGTTEGWLNGIFGLPHDLDFTVSEDAKYRGDYGGKVYAGSSIGSSCIGYDKLCSFEEYEGYLYTVYCKIESGLLIYPKLYGADDNGNYIRSFDLGYLNSISGWQLFQAILRGVGEITHFKVGIYAYTNTLGDTYYFDEAKLIPLRSLKSHHISYKKTSLGVTSDMSWYCYLACLGSCKLRSIVRTTNVSGTSPTLDVTVRAVILEDDVCQYTLTHSQFTGDDFEEVTLDVANIGYIYVEYALGGSSPSFDIRHIIRLEPY